MKNNNSIYIISPPIHLMKPKKFQKLPNCNLPLSFSEKINCNIKEIPVRTEEEINNYKRLIGYRKARVKRYGKIPSKIAR